PAAALGAGQRGDASGAAAHAAATAAGAVAARAGAGAESAGAAGRRDDIGRGRLPPRSEANLVRGWRALGHTDPLPGRELARPADRPQAGAGPRRSDPAVVPAA